MKAHLPRVMLSRQLEWNLCPNVSVSPMQAWSPFTVCRDGTCFSLSEIQSRSLTQAVDMQTSLLLPVDSENPPALWGNPLTSFQIEKLGKGRGVANTPLNSKVLYWIAKCFLQDTIITCRTFSQCRKYFFSVLLSVCFALRCCGVLLSRWCWHTAECEVQVQSTSLGEGGSLWTKIWAAKPTEEGLLDQRPSFWAAKEEKPEQEGILSEVSI